MVRLRCVNFCKETGSGRHPARTDGHVIRHRARRRHHAQQRSLHRYRGDAGHVRRRRTFPADGQNSSTGTSNFPGTTTPHSITWRRWSRWLRNFCFNERIEIHLFTRMDDVEMEGKRIKAVTGRAGKKRFASKGMYLSTPRARQGPPAQCHEVRQRLCHVHPALSFLWGKGQHDGQMRHHGNGRKKGDQIGAMSGSCKLFKESLSREIIDTLGKKRGSGHPHSSIPAIRRKTGHQSLPAVCPPGIP